MKGKCYGCGSGEHMANNCQVAKDIKCRTCNASGHIAAACLPTASIRAVEGESNAGPNTLALEYQPDRQQQQQQNKQSAQVNYVQSFPSLQAVYPNRETGRYYSFNPGQGNTANINAVSTTVTEGKKKNRMKKEKSQAASVHDLFVNKQMAGNSCLLRSSN